jgi:hypothetical protein
LAAYELAIDLSFCSAKNVQRIIHKADREFRLFLRYRRARRSGDRRANSTLILSKKCNQAFQRFAVRLDSAVANVGPRFGAIEFLFKKGEDRRPVLESFGNGAEVAASFLYRSASCQDCVTRGQKLAEGSDSTAFHVHRFWTPEGYRKEPTVR